MLEELKCDNKTVGLKQSLRALESNSAVRVFLAKDCAPHIYDEILNNCKKYKVPIEFAGTMSELGRACGIDVGAAVAVITK